MALINCPECGKDISDKAPSCPNCGLPLKPKEEQSGARIACPKCKSENLEVITMSDGFSKTKAAVGGVLLGGVGLLAGMAGSDKIKLYCKSCGHTFLHSEAYHIMDTKTMSDIDKELIELKKEGGILVAIKKYKDLTGCDLSTAKEYVESLPVQGGINKTNNGGCLTVIIIAVISSILLAII